MKTKSIKQSLHRGFSLVELLVVIAVIAIIAAIAIPNIANITSQATDAKSRRNAQNIASVASAARAAGVTGNLHLKDDVIGLLETTVESPGTGMKFGISPLTDAEETAAKRFLSDNDDAQGAVLYNPSNS